VAESLINQRLSSRDIGQRTPAVEQITEERDRSVVEVTVDAGGKNSPIAAEPPINQR